eukprot:CAMPEP_0203829382 /NCGR_PEP_ID=MMETSP0115-20131106/63470_1 /ASSEMBLY_ACC=CAM_ASM_000227 /TAXON_ID=33651 /ORGANISM="Bicosoecid sp, Strain ms1" /LENGTH=87 /DNA_ID=CAMNT_0050738445 /DNA_START=411 /DNA_END=670 /DNA_ORIENTATION=-
MTRPPPAPRSRSLATGLLSSTSRSFWCSPAAVAPGASATSSTTTPTSETAAAPSLRHSRALAHLLRVAREGPALKREYVEAGRAAKA